MIKHQQTPTFLLILLGPTGVFTFSSVLSPEMRAVSKNTEELKRNERRWEKGPLRNPKRGLSRPQDGGEGCRTHRAPQTSAAGETGVERGHEDSGTHFLPPGQRKIASGTTGV